MGGRGGTCSRDCAIGGAGVSDSICRELEGVGDSRFGGGRLSGYDKSNSGCSKLGWLLGSGLGGVGRSVPGCLSGVGESVLGG